MNELSSSATPPDPQTELAKERNRVAADRTLLGWVRLTVSFIGMGFGIDQLLSALGAIDRAKLESALDFRLVGLLFLGLGVCTVLAAVLDYQGELRRFRQPVYTYTPRPSVGMFVAGALVILAMVMLVLFWVG
jgi:putative membrane protein